MKLGALKQGDKFRYPGQTSGFYVMGSAIPGTMGERFYVHSGMYVYTGGGFFDEEVERIGNINEE
jgi:hypothetical protein